MNSAALGDQVGEPLVGRRVDIERQRLVQQALEFRSVAPPHRHGLGERDHDRQPAAAGQRHGSRIMCTGALDASRFKGDDDGYRGVCLVLMKFEFSFFEKGSGGSRP